ncbi:hypothetical protein GGS20DRAFT_186211 [Poronia punctata]|nr:hypothetical protein GGS20DRAFT_186211 [Poronia punctata]
MAYSVTLQLVDDRVGLIVMASIFTPLVMAVVAARIYSRRLSGARLGPDDWLALVALVFVLALNGIFIAGTVQGAITGHSPVVNNWPQTTELEHLAQKYKYAFQTMEKIAFGLIKLSILFLWKRIFTQPRGFVQLCWIMIGVIIAWTVAFFFATVFQCGTEWSKNWAPIFVFLTQCTNTLNMLTVFTVTDIVTDLIIILMPLPLTWRLHMHTRRKIGVSAIFLVGFFTIGAGIARAYVYLVTSYDKEHNPDFIGDFTLFILWSEIEVNIAMIVCCMATLAPALGVLREVLVGLLPRALRRKWMLLSERPNPRLQRSKNYELSSHHTLHTYKSMNIHPDIAPWMGNSGTVTIAAGHDEEGQKLAGSDNILARTEITSTSQVVPPEQRGHVNIQFGGDSV